MLRSVTEKPFDVIRHGRHGILRGDLQGQNLLQVFVYHRRYPDRIAAREGICRPKPLDLANGRHVPWVFFIVFPKQVGAGDGHHIVSVVPGVLNENRLSYRPGKELDELPGSLLLFGSVGYDDAAVSSRGKTTVIGENRERLDCEVDRLARLTFESAQPR